MHHVHSFARQGNKVSKLRIVSTMLSSCVLAGTLSVSCIVEDDDDGSTIDPNGSDSGSNIDLDAMTGSDAGADGTTGDGSADADMGLQCPELNGLGSCGGTELEATIKTSNVLLVIDKSLSMVDTPEGFGTNKWAAMKTAVSEALNGVKNVASFGLALYPAPANPNQPITEDCGSQGNCCEVPSGPAAIQVPVGAGTESVPQIIDQLEATSPGGGTPTAVALQEALTYYTIGAGASLTGDKYVLLATDGGPNCNPDIECEATSCTNNLDGICDIENCCAGSKELQKGCVDDARTLAKIEELHSAGIKTFVVGIPGTEAYATYLDKFATEGGAPNPEAPPSYYAVSAEGGVAGLTQVFKDITQSLIQSCIIELPQKPPNPEEVNVALDCNVILKDDGNGNGWKLDTAVTPATVTLTGSVCTSVETEGVQRADVVFGCPTIR